MIDIRQPAFSVYADSLGEWRFRFTCADGVDRLRASEGYRAKASALKAIESVKRNATLRERFTLETNTRGKHFFTLRARNGNVLAMSRNHAELEHLLDDLAHVQSESTEAAVRELVAS